MLFRILTSITPRRLKAVAAVSVTCLALSLASPVVAQDQGSNVPPELIRADQLAQAGDYAGALALVRPLAEAGHYVAQDMMGTAYLTGQGVPYNPPQAFEWYRRSAIQGGLSATAEMARLLSEGAPGLPADPARAFVFASDAAEEDYPLGVALLGRFYERGIGVEQDLPRAQALYQRALALGSEWAPEYLGAAYVSGAFGEPDHERARAYYEQAVAMGNGQSMSNLGIMLTHGMGGPADLPRAEQLFRSAMAAGYLAGRFRLALALHTNEPSQARDAEAVSLCETIAADPRSQEGWITTCSTLLKRVQSRY